MNESEKTDESGRLLRTAATWRTRSGRETAPTAERAVAVRRRSGFYALPVALAVVFAAACGDEEASMGVDDSECLNLGALEPDDPIDWHKPLCGPVTLVQRYPGYPKKTERQRYDEMVAERGRTFADAWEALAAWEQARLAGDEEAMAVLGRASDSAWAVWRAEEQARLADEGERLTDETKRLVRWSLKASLVAVFGVIVTAAPAAAQADPCADGLPLFDCLRAHGWSDIREPSDDERQMWVN